MPAQRNNVAVGRRDDIMRPTTKKKLLGEYTCRELGYNNANDPATDTHMHTGDFAIRQSVYPVLFVASQAAILFTACVCVSEY